MGVNRHGHAMKGTISVDPKTTELLPDVSDELIAYFKKHLKTRMIRWWMIAHEVGIGEDGKLHIHFVVIFNFENPGGYGPQGAKQCNNYKKTLRGACPLVQICHERCPEHGVKLALMSDTKWVHEYLQKETERDDIYHNMPPDLALVQPYLSKPSQGGNVAADQTLHKYAAMAKETGLDKECGLEDVCLWYNTAVHVDKTIKSLENEQKEVNLCIKLHKYLTATAEFSEAQERAIAKSKKRCPERAARVAKIIKKSDKTAEDYLEIMSDELFNGGKHSNMMAK